MLQSHRFLLLATGKSLCKSWVFLVGHWPAPLQTLGYVGLWPAPLQILGFYCWPLASPFYNHVTPGGTGYMLDYLFSSRIHERIVSLRFLGIILRVLRLEVSVYNVNITNQFQPAFTQGGRGVKSVSRGDSEYQGGKLLRVYSASV